MPADVSTTASLTTTTASAPLTRRQLRRAARREEVLDAAMAIVIEDGYDGLTIAKIAHRLGAAVGALYRYFPGKEGVIRGLQARAMADLQSYVREHVAEAQASLDDVADDVGELVLVGVASMCFLHHGVDRVQMHELVDRFIAPLTPVYSAAEAQEVEEELVLPALQIYTDLLSSAAKQGALEAGDARLRTLQLWASFHGLDHFRKRDRLLPDRLKTRPVTAAMLAVLWRGWGASKVSVETALAVLDEIVPVVSYS